MLEKLRALPKRISPALLIAGGVLALVAVAGVVLLLTRRDAAAEPAIEPVAARFQQVDGSVGIARVRADDQQLDWAQATANMPVTVGDRIYARDSAKAEIALTGRNYARLDPETMLDVLTLTEHRTQLALRSGSSVFEVGALPDGDFFEVATPCGAVDFKEPGLYQIGMDGENAVISVLSGAAQVVGAGGSGYISKGQVYTLYADGSEAAAATLAPDLAGKIVDGYYREHYPRIYDGRYASYDAYLADPFFYDPYRFSTAYQYLPVDIPGLYDLDYYGDWAVVSGYGRCWAPRVGAGWAPFRYGYWDLDDLWGPSWVSFEPWGWAPYHYGRWAFISQRWYWVPFEVSTRPVYCPAPVAFIPFQDEIAWVPLGPGEVYVPRYYDEGLHPQFLASAGVIDVVSARNTFLNFDAPGGVTVVPIRALSRAIDPTALPTVDLTAVRKARPVLDPFSVSGVRELALKRADARGRLGWGRVESEITSRPVVSTNAPEALPMRPGIARALRVESVPEGRRKGNLKVDRTGVVNSIRSNGLPQTPAAASPDMSGLASRAERGDQSARRELRRMMREEQRANRQQPAVGAQQQGRSKPELRQRPNAEHQAQQQQLQTRQRLQVPRQQPQRRQAAEQAARQSRQQQVPQRRIERRQPPPPQQPLTRSQGGGHKPQRRGPPETVPQLLQQRDQLQSRARWRRGQQVTVRPGAEQTRQAALQRSLQVRQARQQSVIQQRQFPRPRSAQLQVMTQQQAAQGRESRQRAVRPQGVGRVPSAAGAAIPAPQQRFPGQPAGPTRAGSSAKGPSRPSGLKR